MNLRLSLATTAILAACIPALSRAAAEGPKLALPIACEIGRTCEVQHYVDRDPGAGARDYRCSHRTYDKHNGVDIRLLDMAAQRRGVDVLAAAPGKVARLRDGVEDVSVRTRGLAAVSGQECGNGVVIDHGGGWETQYCHLAKGSVRVKPGDVVKAGTPVGKVGLSGQTEFPHLHMTVRRAGQVVDPFAPGPVAPGVCAAKGSMWTPQAAKALAYKEGVILNAGFAGVAEVSNETIEAGGIAPPSRSSPALVSYFRVVEPSKGDVMELTLRGPDGKVLAADKRPPLESDKAQFFAMVGKRSRTGWPPGRYAAELKVWRGGKLVMQRQIAVVL